MKKVTLIGDSIRMGYQRTVEQELADTAVVWAPEQNGGDSDRVRSNLQQWLQADPGDVVHLNCGLHDIKKSFETGEPQVDADTYRANLIHIFDACLEAGRRLVWASTTPVNEQWHHARKEFDRFSADVDAYNAIAREEAERRRVPINDLHALITDLGPDCLLVEDGVHFSEEGSRRLGQAVAACLRQQWKDAQ